MEEQKAPTIDQIEIQLVRAIQQFADASRNTIGQLQARIEELEKEKE